jgi:hypothetical protein
MDQADILNTTSTMDSVMLVSSSSSKPNEQKENDEKEKNLEKPKEKLKKKKPKSTFPFGMCKVCNDKATGVHYGISTCEGCKVKSFLFFSFFFKL